MAGCDDRVMRLVGSKIDPARFAGADVTYPERGATRGELPPGYRHVAREAHIGTGPTMFHDAAEALIGWHMHRHAGLKILSAPARANPQSVALMRLGPPVIGILVPCRVIYVVNEARSRGFAYGTLPGHPVHGEEAFVVTLADHDAVIFTIRAFSRPASVLTRAGGPLGRAIQDLTTDRYIQALRELAS
jgi:uncharacterized protein (UPF0548 family)